MGRWVNTRVFRKKYYSRDDERIDCKDSNKLINLRDKVYGNLIWENERLFVTPKVFTTGYYRGDLICNANPIGSNIHRVDLDIIYPDTGDKFYTGRIYRTGETYVSNARHSIFNGTLYGFTFILRFMNRSNGVYNNCGYNIWCGGELVAQYYITGDTSYLNSSQVSYLNFSGKTGEIVIEPIGSMYYVLGYEHLTIHNFIIWTSPMTSSITGYDMLQASWIAVEGDM